MTKKRVYEYARSKDVQSKLIISKLSDMGYQVKGHMSVLEVDMVNKLDKLFKPEKEAPEITKRASGPRIKVEDTPKTESKPAEKPAKPSEQSKPSSSRPTVRQQAYSSDRPQGQRQGGYQNRPQGDRPQGGHQNRPQGDRPQGGYQNRPQGDRPQGGQQNRPQGDRPQGGYQNRPQGDRPQGGYQNRPQGDRPQGGYQNRPQGDRPQSGYQNRPQGDRPQGGYQNRPQGDRPQGGYQNRQGGGQGQGGYQNRQGQGQGQGGYQNRQGQGQGQGGYQNRQGQGQGGYQNRQGGGQGQGGYQNRQGQGQGQGGYQNRQGQGQGQGGYQNRQGQGQGQGQGGYQNRQGQGQGGYQNRQGQGQGQGGYQNRQGQGQGQGQGGMSAPVPNQPQSSGASNYNRPSKPIGRSFQSKKIAEEKRREEERIFGKKGQQPVVKKQKELPEKITFSDSLTTAELAKKLHREPSEVIKKLFMMGAMATINTSLDKDAIELLCADYGVEVEEIIIIDQTDLDAVIADDDEALNTFERPAVVTIMGHVDHGKTTLLDSIRKTKVTEGEAGGITQHIGAYQVEILDRKITFLDTPGHAAFTTMRARGAKVTDVAILVVAGDDGVKPQTVEAINHAKDAKCPIIIAVNKMDKPEANMERVKTELSQYGIVPEEWGGDNIFVPISAKMGDGIENLLETIILVSEVAELKCNKDRLALGTVIEAHLDKGKGPVATLLVQNGTLRIGDPIVVGNAFGRVRAMIDDNGKKVKDALPSTPIELTGLNEVPNAGDRFVVFEDEKTARSVGEQRATNYLLASRDTKAKVTLDNLFDQLKDGEVRELNVIVKADVQGSQEALIASLMKIDVEGVRVRTVHAGVGAISESDILLAKSSGSIVIGFNVRPDQNAKRAADAEKVDLRIHNIIYNVIEEIEQAMTGMLDPEFEEVITGQAEVRQLVKISKVGTIAGSYVTEGKIVRDAKVRIIRGGVVVHEGDLNTLKRFKDDVKEVAAGYECGIAIKGYNALEEGDIIEAFVMEEIERKTK